MNLHVIETDCNSIYQIYMLALLNTKTTRPMNLRRSIWILRYFNILFAQNFFLFFFRKQKKEPQHEIEHRVNLPF